MKHRKNEHFKTKRKERSLIQDNGKKANGLIDLVEKKGSKTRKASQQRQRQRRVEAPHQKAYYLIRRRKRFFNNISYKRGEQPKTHQAQLQSKVKRQERVIVNPQAAKMKVEKKNENKNFQTEVKTMIHRGTTPTFRFEVEGLDLSTMTELSVAFSQDGTLILEKRLVDCEVKGNTIDVYLTEDETLQFTTKNRQSAYIETQLKFGFENKRVISDINKIIVKPILKEGKLNAV